jgi:hypothetical protein
MMPNNNVRAFYYWQTTMKFDKENQQLQEDLKLEEMYVRCFDVDWSAGYQDGIPLGILTNEKEILKNSKDLLIIPTVFIVNRVFKHLPDDKLERLASNILRKIPYDSIQYKEVQLDCDWTASTKEKYFKFLEIFKNKLPPSKILSITIRLHQYRDRELMGIPPVDRGMLMCYNVANPKEYYSKNSILDAEIVAQYLRGEKYPVPLDIGLPMFFWGSWFNSREQFENILSGWGAEDAADRMTYDSIGSDYKENLYRLKKDTVIGNNYLREGDLIRFDGAFEAEMNETIQLIKKQINPKNARIAFFDWNFDKIKKHHEANLEKYYSKFD